MPKSVKRKQEIQPARFTMELTTVGTYDSFDVFHGKVKIGQLTLIRSESSKKFVKLVEAACENVS